MAEKEVITLLPLFLADDSDEKLMKILMENDEKYIYLVCNSRSKMLDLVSRKFASVNKDEIKPNFQDTGNINFSRYFDRLSKLAYETHKIKLDLPTCTHVNNEDLSDEDKNLASYITKNYQL